MHWDIVPMRVPTALATLQSHTHTQDDTDMPHAVVHCKRAARDIAHAMHARRTAVASAV
jgi:hypothetical protein